MWVHILSGILFFSVFSLIGQNILPRVIKTICTTQDSLLILGLNRKWKLGCDLSQRQNIWTDAHNGTRRVWIEQICTMILTFGELGWKHFLIEQIPSDFKCNSFHLGQIESSNSNFQKDLSYGVQRERYKHIFSEKYD